MRFTLASSLFFQINFFLTEKVNFGQTKKEIYHHLHERTSGWNRISSNEAFKNMIYSSVDIFSSDKHLYVCLWSSMFTDFILLQSELTFKARYKNRGPVDQLGPL